MKVVGSEGEWTRSLRNWGSDFGFLLGVEGFHCVENFPKSQRFILGQRFTEQAMDATDAMDCHLV